MLFDTIRTELSDRIKRVKIEIEHGNNRKEIISGSVFLYDFSINYRDNEYILYGEGGYEIKLVTEQAVVNHIRAIIRERIKELEKFYKPGDRRY